ncbi:MAG: ABC transporter substrate-binding protein [Fluviicola sp.]
MRTFMFFFLLSGILASCTSSTGEHEIYEKEYTSINLKYAQFFRLKQKGNEFLLQLLDPDTKKVVQSVVISEEKNPRIICLTATLTGMFCELNQRNFLIGVSAENQLYDNQLKQAFRSGKVQEYGDFAQLSLERIADAQPNVILYNFVNTDFPQKEKLEKLGVKMLIVNDWLEAHPLAKAEWIKVIGAMTGQYKKSCDLFDKIEAKYLQIAERVNGFETHPTVISGNLIGGNWYAPSGENYFGLLIKDAGGDYRYKDTKGQKSLSLPLEKILKDNEETEVWLNPGVSKWNQLLQLNPHAELLSPSESGEIYCYSAHMNKFWEESALRADFVLEDLAHIFHPDMDVDYTFHYYSKLKK